MERALTIGRRRAAHRRSAPGYALVLVLMFAALVTIAGTGFLAFHSLEAPQAYNMRGAVRADYLAGSAVSIASHYLAIPPSTVTAGNYWTGASGLSIDGTTDTVDITVTRDLVRPTIYTVSSTGIVRDPDGTVRARKSVTADINTPPPKSWTLSRVFNSAGATTITNHTTLKGSLHANGNVTGQVGSSCQGVITATGSISWAGGGPPSSMQPNSTALALPTVNTSAWSRYVVHGVVYQPRTISSSSLGTLSVVTEGGTLSSLFVLLANGKIAVVDLLGSLLGGLLGLGADVQVVTSSSGLTGASLSASHFLKSTNPGGVLVSTGDLDLNSLALVGTLVVPGRLRVRSLQTVSITSMPNYPALVVTGDLEVEDWSNFTVNGPVLVGGRIRGQRPTINASGAWLSTGAGFDSDFVSGGSAALVYTTDFADFYDFSATVGHPMTLLRWTE